MNDCPKEDKEQRSFLDFLDLKGIIYFASPASFFSSGGDQNRKFGMIRKLKHQGWSKGFPDILCIVPCKWDGKKRLVFVEMKREKGGTVSQEQKEWLAKLNECEQVEATVCNGAGNAIEYIQSFTC